MEGEFIKNFFAGLGLAVVIAGISGMFLVVLSKINGDEDWDFKTDEHEDVEDRRE